MKITNYRVETAMGKMTKFFGHPLPFLSQSQSDEFDKIGSTGTDNNGNPNTRTKYLNSLGMGKFVIEQIKFDSAEFTEEFIVTRVEL